jgi:hypothetical protein
VSGPGADGWGQGGLAAKNQLTREPSSQLKEEVAVGVPQASDEVGKLPSFGVFFSHILQAELLRLQKRVFVVERGMVEEFTRRYSKCFGDGFDDVGGGVLAALLDVTEVALGDSGFVGESLQSVIPVRAKPADCESYVVSESPLGHCLTPEFEGCPDWAASDSTPCSV